MWGAIIGAAVAAGSAIAGGVHASKEARKNDRQLRAQQRANENWYNQRYNEDSTQRADAQRMLTQTQEAIRSRNREASGSQAVMGGTDASTASTKEANNAALADATSRIAASGDARKDAIEEAYINRDSNIANQISASRTAKAQNIGQATANVGNAASGLAKEFDF